MACTVDLHLDLQPTVDRQLANCLPTVSRLLAGCWLIVSQLLIDNWPTVGWLLVVCPFIIMELFLATTNITFRVTEVTPFAV